MINMSKYLEKKRDNIHTQIVNFNNEIKIPVSVKCNWNEIFKKYCIRNEELFLLQLRKESVNLKIGKQQLTKLKMKRKKVKH